MPVKKSAKRSKHAKPKKSTRNASKRASSHDQVLRKQVALTLGESHAHAGFDAAVDGFPPELRGEKPQGSPHSAWELLEHIRIAQWDILEFSRDGRHKSPAWPEEYWPKTAAPPSDSAWDDSVRKYRADNKAMQKLVLDPKRDLSAIVPHGESQTLIREALLVIDHNAYHIGEIVFLRRLLGAWKPA